MWHYHDNKDISQAVSSSLESFTSHIGKLLVALKELIVAVLHHPWQIEERYSEEEGL